jgi:hypothetical protein
VAVTTASVILVALLVNGYFGDRQVLVVSSGDRSKEGIRHVATNNIRLAPVQIAADDKKPVEKMTAEKLAQFQGVWVTDRETKEGDNVRRYRQFLAFEGEKLTVYRERDGKKYDSFTFGVTVEMERGGPGLVEVSRLLLQRTHTKYAIYFQFDGDSRSWL